MANQKTASTSFLYMYALIKLNNQFNQLFLILNNIRDYQGDTKAFRIDRGKMLMILLLSLFVTCLYFPPSYVAARYKEGKVGSRASVTFTGYEEVSAGYKFEYIVRSGIGKQKIRFWYLNSDAFSYYQVVSASEKYTQKTGTLRFPKSFRNAEVRTVEFVLKKEYSQPKIDYIQYIMKLQWLKSGNIKGPTMPGS